MASEARQAEGWARELAVEARTGGGWPEAAAAGFVNRVLGSARQNKKKAEYSDLFEARFRLYQNRFLKVDGCVASFSSSTTFSYTISEF